MLLCWAYVCRVETSVDSGMDGTARLLPARWNEGQTQRGSLDRIGRVQLARATLGRIPGTGL